ADDIEDFECELPARLRLGWRTDVYVYTRVCDEDDEDRLGISVEVEIGFGEDAGSGGYYSPRPSARDRHVAVAYRGNIYIFGGYDGSTRVNDFWLYDTQAQSWAL
ncbi:Leucine-zipper-like transcriptional regulator 1, partial [Perkinsus olseni]